MITDDVQNLIEKSILSGKQLKIHYTNSKGITDHYLIRSITSTWTTTFNTVAESTSKGRTRPFNKFRYDRISAIDITNEPYEANELLIEKLKDGSLFSDVDNRIVRRGGLKGYGSSISYIAGSHERLQKEEARNILRQIDITSLDGWERGIILDITDGDTFEVLIESDPYGSYVTRLFGVDTPECRHGSEDEIFGLEAKVAVEDLFKNSRYCYVKQEGKDAYRRHVMHVLNADKKNVAIELLANGLGFPMMGYFADSRIRDTYVNATRQAYEVHKGLWAIDEIRCRYNNVLSDTTNLEIDILGHIPTKASAVNRYLNQSPKAKIIYAALQRKKRCEANKTSSKDIFSRITQKINHHKYDLDAFKELCQFYLKEIDEIAKSSASVETVRDHIMYIEDLIDELQLGEGEIKGNFSKGKKKLVYHDNPEDRFYKLCIPEIRFRTVADAKYCGFKKGG